MDVGVKRAKIEAGDELDRFTALPLHLKESILELLPIEDAIATSVLSTRWRYCWTGMRRFELYSLGNQSIEVFRKTIDRILLLHDGPIEFINFIIPENGNNMNVNLADWFHVLSKNGIERVVVDSSSGGTQSFLVPRSLFQCRDLKYLTLISCVLTPPSTFVGFKHLTSLEFDVCTVRSQFLGNLISQCPLLEYLSLVYTCTKPYDNQPLVINAPNLRKLVIVDDFYVTVAFQNVPKLSNLSLVEWYGDSMVDERPCFSWDFICSVYWIQKIKLLISLLVPVIGKCPKCLPMTLENMRTMSLSSVNASVEDDLCLVLCLVRSSPGLQHLKIAFDHRKTARLPEPDQSRQEAEKLLETEIKESFRLSNVSTVVIKRMEWLECEIMLVKVFLSRCPNVKSLMILPDFDHTEDFHKEQARVFEGVPNMDKLLFSKEDRLRNAISRRT